jgi:Cytochrome c554 and c-prime
LRWASRVGLFFLFWFQTSLSLVGQLSTTDHLAEPGFWPTQNGVTRAEYVGPGACTPCHAGKVASQKSTPMAQTSMHADDADILHSHPEMHFAISHYRYEIKSTGKRSVYTVTDGPRTLSATVLWAFGTGRVGQSYLFKRDDGNFYEARVTYFETLKTLDFTPSRALTSPKDVEEAMYRPVDAAEIGRCFACHTTALTIGNRFDEKNLILGVTCEACHGPGAKHVASAEAATMAGMPDAARGTMFNASQLSPTDSVDFCGACHGTWWDIKLSGVKGVSTARSQPYRLESSKCWGKGDSRITCIACHDPHQQLQTDPSAYEGVCLKCHAASAGEKKTASHPGMPCPSNTRNCVSCHMPKVYVPEMHYNFTDHRIRVVKQGDAYPD